MLALWSVAILLTLAFLVWQKMSGPTYPVRAVLQLEICLSFA